MAQTDPRPDRNVYTYGTTFGGTAAAYGTLVAAPGVNQAIWVDSVSIINGNAGTITSSVGFGTALQGATVLAGGDFGPREGIAKSYPHGTNAGTTNKALVAYVGAAGTVNVAVTYFVS